MGSIRERLLQVHRWQGAVVALFCASVSADPGWLPIAAKERNKPTSNIVANRHGVLAYAPGTLFRLPGGGQDWQVDSTLSLYTLMATPSFHFLVTGASAALMDSTGKVRGMYPGSEAGFYPRDIAEDSTRLYVRTMADSIFFADKADLIWRPENSMPPTIWGPEILALPDQVLLATGQDLFQSRDRGLSWRKLDIAPGENVLTVFRRGGNDVYAKTAAAGAYRSADRGMTWSPLVPGDYPHPRRDYNAFEVSGDTIWLAWAYESSSNQGVLRSVDRGRTWSWHHAGMEGVEATGGGGGGAGYRYYPVGTLVRASGALWVANDIGQNYRSVDGGSTWTDVRRISPDGERAAVGLFALGTEIRGVMVTNPDLGHQQVLAYDPAGRRWIPDTAFLPTTRLFLQGASGDTVFMTDESGLKWKTGRSRPWENLSFPWDSLRTQFSGITGIQAVGKEIFLGERYAQSLHYSDDAGRTWRYLRPFRPRIRFQGAWLEGRGKLLCQPDDSLHAPPKPWREFPQPIRDLWVLGEDLAVRAGATLYLSATGATWREIALPDTGQGMAFSLDEGVLTGYTVDTAWTLSRVGRWQPRPLRLPLRSVKAISAGSGGVWVHYNDYRKVVWYGKDGATGEVKENLPADDFKLADGGSYLLRGRNWAIDTLSYSDPDLLRGIDIGLAFPGAWSWLIALFADGDFMAVVTQAGDFRASADRGKTWNVTGKVPTTTVKAAGSAGCLFSLASGALRVSRDSGRTWAVEAVERAIVDIGGRSDFLAALEKGGRILVSVDSAKTWSPLPALPALPGTGETVATCVAVHGRQVFAGTQEHGIFRWGEEETAGVRLQDRRLDGVSAAPAFRRGWVRVPGQGLLYGVDPGTRVDMIGRKNAAKPDKR